MTRFLQPKFSVNVGGKDYADGWERTFGKSVETAELLKNEFNRLVAPENGHGIADDFGGEDFPSQPEQLTFKNVIEPYVTYRPMYQTESVTVPASQAPGWALAERKERIAASSEKLGKMLDEARYDNAIVDLDDYQKRQQAWTEHNFPLKPNEEHRRIAREWIANAWEGSESASPEYVEEWHGSDIDSLSYLLAARDHRSYRPLLGAVEELGELCHAHLKNEQGIRGTPEEWREKKQDAIGDTLIYLLDYCNREGFSMQECLEKAWAEVSLRDWVKFPKNGRTE